MDAVLRATIIYFFIWALLRAAGKRTLAEATPFDFVLLLIVAESTQQALLGEDFSLTNALVLITTLVGIDILLSLFKHRSKRVTRILEGQLLILLENGRPLQDRMQKVRVEESDVLEAARQEGLERMDQIKYAVLEQSGGISIVPRQ